MAGIAFHFILLAIGEVLKSEDYVDPQRLQNFIVRDDAFGGYRIELPSCRLALQLMESSGFIKKIDKEKYIWNSH